MAKNENTSKRATDLSPLIAHLWARAKRVQLALLQILGSEDASAIEMLQLQLRCLALLISSTPAKTMADLDPKVLLSAIYREGLAGAEPSYVRVLIERCISEDMFRLQGPPLVG